MKKKLFLLISILLFAININAQIFPGKKVDILLNKIVKAKEYEPKDQKYHYRNFYLRFDTIKKKLVTIDLNDNDIKPFQTKDGIYSDYNKLVGKEFTVKKIYKQKTRLSSAKNKKYVLELYNNEIGTVYYDYDTRYEFEFELEILSKIQLPSDFYCNDITEKKDKFTGEITYKSPIKSGIQFTKVVSDDNSSTIFMSITAPGKTLNVGKKGLIILLENGEKINRPNAKINVSVTDFGYAYYALIILSDEEINLLKKYRITDERLYIYDVSISKISGNIIKEYLKCLTK